MFICNQMFGGCARLGFSRAILLLVLVLTASAYGLAQGVGAGRDLSDTGGNHIISGRVYFPSQTAGDVRVKVRLESNSAATLTTQSNADGVFRFSGLNTGSYIVVVDAGDQYDIFREQVDIEGGNTYSPRTVQIPVYLRLKGSGPMPKSGPANPGLVGVPKPALDFYDKGLQFAQKNDPKKAVEQLAKAVEIHPTFALALNEMGVQYLKMGQPEKAAEALQSAVKIMPDEATPHLNYGIALLNLKKFPEAEEHLRTALQKNDKAPTAHMYLGIVLLSRNNLDDAEKELLAAVASNSAEINSSHKYLGGIYWGKRDYKRAADELELYLKLVPKAPDAERTKAAIKELRSKQ